METDQRDQAKQSGKRENGELRELERLLGLGRCQCVKRRNFQERLDDQISIPFTIATGLAAWQWQLEGATLKGNLRLHLVFATTTAAIILILFWKRFRLRKNGNSPSAAYFALMALGLVMIAVTGHLGGILSGVETP